MSNNIDDLKVKLKYCKKERLKELAKNGDFILLAALPASLGIISCLPFIFNGASFKTNTITFTLGASLGSFVGSTNLFTHYNNSIYTKQIRIIKDEIKEEKKLIKQKKLK